jgi:hypothetical protein
MSSWAVRFRLFAALVATIALGLLSRLHPIGWPLYDRSLGDVLYAVAVYLLLALLCRRGPQFVAALALSMCLSVEAFQATGIPARYAHLVLVRWLVGTTFAWHDILCYIVGVAAIVLLDRLALRRHRLDPKKMERPK